MSFDDERPYGGSPMRGTGRPAGGMGTGRAAPSTGYQSGYPVSSAAPPASAGPSNEDEYRRFKAQTDSLVEQMSTAVVAVGRMVPKLNTREDTPDLMRALERETDKVRAISQDAVGTLKKMASLPCRERQQQVKRKAEVSKIRNDLEKQQQQFQGFLRTIKQSEAQRAGRAREYGGGPSGRSEASEADERTTLIDRSRSERDREREQQQAQYQQQSQRLAQMDGAIDFNEQLIEERHQHMVQIEQEINQVNDIFKDLANIVQEQGEMLDTIDNNIESAVMNTDAGTKELGKANEYQKSARSKICCLAVIIVIVAAVIVVPIVLTQK